MSAPMGVDTDYGLRTAFARGVCRARILPVPPSGSALAVSEFPKTYRMVRGGEEQDVDVADVDALVHLRTELAILERFGRGTNDDVMAALEACADSTDGAADDDLAETLQILRDAMSPVIAETVGQIDAAFPQSADSVRLESINQDAATFHKGVAERIAASPNANAEELARAYLSAADVTRDGDDAMSESTDVQATGAAVDEAMTETQTPAEVPDSAETEPVEAQVAASEAEVDAPELNQASLDDTDSAKTVDDVDEMLSSIAADGEAAQDEAAATDPSVEGASTEDAPDSAAEPGVEPIADDATPQDDEPASAEDQVSPDDDDVDEVLDAIGEIAEDTPVAEELLVAEQPTVTDETGLANVDVSTDAARTADVRAQIEEIRAVLTAQTNRLVAVLDQVESMQAEARTTLAHADRLRAAADAARLESTAALDAQETYAQAQNEADQARLSAQQAQAKADAARQALDGLLTDAANA